MNRSLVIFLLGLLFVTVSCDTKNPVEQYGTTAVKAYKDTQQSASRADLHNLQEAIKAFHVANDRYPKDLKELENFTGSPLDSSKYDYDPSQGTITQK
ncbi:MAG TPA: hypothetical protein DCP92_23000 [Nitrospiraceae bacterium]|jgi:hypothetical protein|nr:hypothetical protein [Nitrospiraceae bacterium]